MESEEIRVTTSLKIKPSIRDNKDVIIWKCEKCEKEIKTNHPQPDKFCPSCDNHLYADWLYRHVLKNRKI